MSHSVGGVTLLCDEMMKVSPSRLEGTLAMDDDSCRIVASAASSYSGLMSCRNGQGVPISFSIGEAIPVKDSGQASAK